MKTLERTVNELNITGLAMEVPRLPRRIRRQLRMAFRQADETGLLHPSIRDEVASAAKSGHPLDYASHWAAFAKLYFEQNFAKCFAATSSLRDRAWPSSLRILDLGCGGGASTVGVLSALQAIIRSRRVTLAAVDRSPEQLNLFSMVARDWVVHCLPNVDCTVYRTDAHRFVEYHHRWDIIVASYLFCEHDAAARRSLRRALLEALVDAQHAVAVLVDYDPSVRGRTSVCYQNHDQDLVRI